jgi:hypothetical protein
MGNIKVFQVTRTTPSPLAEGVNTILDIELSFNTDVNVKTLDGGIAVISRNENNVVLGTISYNRNRIVSFKPAVPFKPGTTYDVYVKSSIKNILNMNCKPFSFSFTTQTMVQFDKPMLTYPSNESILNSTPEFRWEESIDVDNNVASKYEIQLSKSEYFETSYWMAETSQNSIQSDIEIDTGVLLFWRVRVISYDTNGNIIPGSWSDVYRFIVAKSIKAPIVEEDGDYLDPAYEDLPQISNDLLKQFPEVNFSNVGTNLKTIYVEINGLLDISTINPKTWTIEGNHITGDTNLDDFDGDIDGEVNHNFLSGQWFIVLDEDTETTYILFQPNKL